MPVALGPAATYSQIRSAGREIAIDEVILDRRFKCVVIQIPVKRHAGRLIEIESAVNDRDLGNVIHAWNFKYSLVGEPIPCTDDAGGQPLITRCIEIVIL